MVRIRSVIQIATYLCVSLSFASVVEYLDIYHAASFACLALGSIYFDRRRIIDIPRWSLNCLSVGILFLATYRVTPEFLIEPILDALIILVAIKLLEDKKIRDYMQIYTMCIFLLMVSSLISMSINFLFYLSLLLCLITICLVLLAYFSHNPEMTISKDNLTRVIHLSLLTFLLSIPLSMILFIILPRTTYPFLNFLNRAGITRSGFTDSISLGQVADIQEDNAVVFRAEMEQIEESRLYWRGVVLDEFDGIRWTSAKDEFEDGALPSLKGWDVAQTIYLEPYGNKYLFALDRPVSFSIYRNKFSRARITPFKTKIFERIRYRAVSKIASAIPQPMTDRNRYVQLPENFSPRIRDLVLGLVADRPEEEQIKNLVHFLQRGNYQYSLEDLPVSLTPIDDFLFVHRRGNCEFFASSLAVMLRMAGIPARIIGGYKGGYYNATGKYYLVAQSNAHVWVEAYSAAHGWLRVDPTPALQELPWHRIGGRVLLQLRLVLDTFNYYWYKVIIDYDFTKQVQILNAVRERMTRPDIKLKINPSQVRNYFISLALLVAIPFFAYVLIKTHKAREERIVSKFLSRMSAHGYEKGRHEGLEEFVSRIDRDDIKDRARVFVEEFERVYYRDMKFTRETTRRLNTLINRIHA
jgi:transglutaminase-like putative cysteine protease